MDTDKLSTLNLTFDKVIIQLVIPGMIAIFPMILMFLDTHVNAKAYLKANSSIAIFAIIILSLIAGMILENLGSRIEVLLFDSWNIKKSNPNSNYTTTWEKFLQLSYDIEPIGQRYIRNILLRMKFELSTCIGLLLCYFGLLFLNNNFPIFPQTKWATIAFIYIAPPLLSIYLFWEAYSSSKVLAKTRQLLVEKYCVEPTAKPATTEDQAAAEKTGVSHN